MEEVGRLNVLLELVTELAEVTELGALLRVTSARIGWLLAFERCSLVLAGDGGARRWWAASGGGPFAEIAAAGVPGGDLQRIEKALLGGCPASTAGAGASVVCFPLLAGERVLGALCLASAAPFGHNDLRLCHFLAQHLASTVRRLEQTEAIARQKDAENRFKDEFLALVSHELRTPMNALLGWVELLRGGTADAGRLAHGLEVIGRNARLQAKLVDDLVDVSRIVAGKLHIEREAFPLERAVRRAVETVEGFAAKTGVGVDVSIDEPDLHIVGDESRVQQIVWNLVTNAVKFSPPRARVTVDVRRSGGEARITVQDRGAGIDAALLPHIFDRFRQGDPSRTRKHGGLGVGLALARHLAELHQGTIRAYSAGPDQGATFVVFLPVAIAALAPAEALAGRAPRHEGPAPAELLGLRILSVDDEEDAREMLAALLAEEGATVVSACSAAAALDVLREQPVDLMVSDIGMPERDGYALLAAVPAATRVKVPAVALTAFASENERERVLSAGFAAYLPKPVEPRRLVGVLAELARGSARARA